MNYFANNKIYIFCDACSLSLMKLVNISDAVRTVWHMLCIQCMSFLSSLYLIQICFSYEIVSYDLTSITALGYIQMIENWGYRDFFISKDDSDI